MRLEGRRSLLEPLGSPRQLPDAAAFMAGPGSLFSNHGQ